ncbi:MAG: DUF1835 domain-containing protein [Colwellia sp.]|nr:DUF1835 domain-containing protein [Colwellia sp.]
MNNVYHILNGDALKSQFPKLIIGELLVARECLVDGNIQGENLDELFSNRAEYLEGYPQIPAGQYYKSSVPEFTKIINIPKGSAVYCWFEDDLFCQVNFWFVLHLLAKRADDYNIYLVRPNQGNEYSFGRMSHDELITAYDAAKIIDTIEHKHLANLWRYYQQKTFNELLMLAECYLDDFPFLLPAINAEIDRLPDDSGYGRPERRLLSIIKKLDSKDFRAVFREFQQSEAIYSFGDLQVKRMFDELLKR